MTIDVFGHMPDGRPVQRIRLRTGGLQARILTLGAIVQDLRMDGVAHPLVLGAETLAPYLGPMHYFGATVGRFANRIAQGRFSLNGQLYQLSRNFRGRHCLHGGQIGSAERLWSVKQVTEDSVTLKLSMPDGDMGFPGNLEVGLTNQRLIAACGFRYLRNKRLRQRFAALRIKGIIVLDKQRITTAHHRFRSRRGILCLLTNDLITTGDIAGRSRARDFDSHPQGLQDVTLDNNF